jgi:hypothetical protein
MYRKKKLSGLYSQSSSILPAESPINFLRMEGDSGGEGSSGDRGISSCTLISPSGSTRGSASSRPEVCARGCAQGIAVKTSLIAEFIRGGNLSHAESSASFGEAALMSLNLPAQPAKNAIRRVKGNLMVDMLDHPGHPIIQALQDFKGFIMAGAVQAGKKEKIELNLPYLLKRVSAKNEVRQ